MIASRPFGAMFQDDGHRGDPVVDRPSDRSCIAGGAAVDDPIAAEREDAGSRQRPRSCADPEAARLS